MGAARIWLGAIRWPTRRRWPWWASCKRTRTALFLEIEQELNEHFRGLLTPSKGLIYNVLYSYAERSAGAWRLREEDTPANRRVDLEWAARLLEDLGARLGYETLEQEGQACHLAGRRRHERVFYLLASALGRAGGDAATATLPKSA